MSCAPYETPEAYRRRQKALGNAREQLRAAEARRREEALTRYYAERSRFSVRNVALAPFRVVREAVRIARERR